MKKKIQKLVNKIMAAHLSGDSESDSALLVETYQDAVMR